MDARRPSGSLSRPGFLLVALVAAIAACVSVSHRISDPDVFQHLTVGKALWSGERVLGRHLWSWPTYGTPEVTPSWAFRAMLWPFYDHGGVTGLFVWRWLTTLAAFGALFAAARALGARALVTLAVIVGATLIYRSRSMVRPETLAAVLLGLELWLLESRRRHRETPSPIWKDRALWTIPVMIVWANAHVSYYLGIFVLAAFAIDDLVTRRPVAGRPRLLLVGLLAAAACLINPFGWKALAQPFEFWLTDRNLPIYRLIRELGPVAWDSNLKNLLPVWIVGWPLLVLIRAARGRVDLAELLMCAAFTAQGLMSQRMLGFYAIVATPYVARGISELIPRAAVRVPGMVRAAMAAAVCVGVGMVEWTRWDMPIGIGWIDARFPIAACDFMQKHRIRGRGFNHFWNSGYLLHRFWPEEDRLPFMDIHQSGTADDRALYPFALIRKDGWDRLDSEYHFDWALLTQGDSPTPTLPDLLDNDSTGTWLMVFNDDAASLYVRRGGAAGAAIDSFAYLWSAGSPLEQQKRLESGWRSTQMRNGLRAEAERQIRESRATGRAHGTLGILDAMEGRYEEGFEHLQLAAALEPTAPGVHEKLGMLALHLKKWDAAIAAYEGEARVQGKLARVHFRRGLVYQAQGNRTRAREEYAAEVRTNPWNAEARDSLAALGGPR